VVLTLQTNADYTVAHHHHQRASVTIVDDFYNNIAPSVTLTSPANDQVFIAPTNITLQADATDPDDTIQQVSFFANDDYLGKATNSPFSLVWSNAPPGHFTLFARATDAAGKSTLSSPVEITVTNAPPTVQLLSPTNGAVFGVPANVVIEANAADADDAVKQVQIYADGHLLGTFTSSPYSLTWPNVPPGKHTVVVRATDAVGLTASASAKFTVTNALPVVKLTSPQSDDTFKAPALIVLKADATDAGDSIRSVTFWANNRLLATVTHSPYSYSWENVKHGVYRIQAIATDSYGMKSVPAVVVISVSK
jgi:predicted phage tail protein